MENRYLTATIKPKHRPRRKRPSGWTIYARLSVLALAAMMTARLVLLMIDVIQTGVDAPGAVAIPLYAAWLIFTGWKLREWTTRTKGKETERCSTECAPIVEITLTPERSATVGREGATGVKEKTMEDLMRGGPAATLEDILLPGDAVAEEIVDDIRDSLPPTTNRANLMQSGEPSDYRLDPRAGCMRPTYTTFERRGGQWYYCGRCFEGDATSADKLAGATA